MSRLSSLFDILAKTPHDIYAAFMLALGSVLVLCGHKDEGMLVIGGGLAAFKGKTGE